MDCLFETETIDDAQFLFYRVHKDFIRLSKVTPNAFRSQGDGMSVDWDKYSTSKDTYSRCKIPSDNAIVKLNVGDVRKEKTLEVIHKPENANRSHSLVKGIPEKDPFKTEVRRHLTKIHSVEIPFKES